MSDIPVEVLSVQSISKRFGAVRALSDVSLSLAAGQVHCVIGENGAGKSTLMKILSGVERPDSGDILHRGANVTFKSPADAQRVGIGMIHQELNLVDELSVAGNIFLGREPRRLGLVNNRWMNARAAELLNELNCPIDPTQRIRELSIAHKQMVEIAKAVGTVASAEWRMPNDRQENSRAASSLDTRHSTLANSSVLIMDEPTAVLTRREVMALFQLIERLKAKGVAIVYISHILSEVLAVGDRVTVMRDGRSVETLSREKAQQIGEHGLASLMVGRPMGDHFPPRARPESRLAFEVRNLSVPGKVRNATFAIQAGEVLGFAGLIGAGRTELAEAIVGLRKRDGGEILVEGTPVVAKNPRAAGKAGIAYLSEDRKGAGLTLGMGIVENTTMVSLKRYCHPLISRREEDAATLHHVEQLHIKVGRLRDPIESLSGGNQQKVALAKWLEIGPKVLIIDEPTRGVDVGAKEQIYALIRSLTAQGMACMLISSELNEVIGLSNRIAVMRAGRIVATMDAAGATEEKIMYHAAGVTPQTIQQATATA